MKGDTLIYPWAANAGYWLSRAMGVGAIAFGTSPTRVFDRPTTGCGGGARILDFRGMNPALYCLSYTAENEKARMA